MSTKQEKKREQAKRAGQKSRRRRQETSFIFSASQTKYWGLYFNCIKVCSCLVHCGVHAQ